jgi:superfamily I DNA/RNA helicase
VLILCYANGIAGRLEDVMQERGVEDRVQVRTFHSWCHQMLKTYGIASPTEAEYLDYNQRLAALVRYVGDETMLGHVPGGQYDVVLIDEAHHFEPAWLSLAVKMVNPNTKAFIIAYDDMQAIYKGMGRPVCARRRDRWWRLRTDTRRWRTAAG